MPKAINPETLEDIDWSLYPPGVLETVWRLCEEIPEEQKTIPVRIQSAAIHRAVPPPVATHIRENPTHVSAVSVIEARMTPDQIRIARRRSKGAWER